MVLFSVNNGFTCRLTCRSANVQLAPKVSSFARQCLLPTFLECYFVSHILNACYVRRFKVILTSWLKMKVLHQEIEIPI